MKLMEIAMSIEHIQIFLDHMGKAMPTMGS